MKLNSSIFVSVILSLSLLTGPLALAQKAKKPAAAKVAEVQSVDQTADELGAKAFIEEMLTRRFTQSLATIVDKQSFQVSTQIQLGDFEDPDTAPALDEKPSDLTVGYLDAEQLLKKYGLEGEKAQFAYVLANKKIKGVAVNVGLSENLGAEVKAEVEKWMQNKVKTEFGGSSKVEVAFIKMEAAKQDDSKPKNWWDWLRQFQQLAAEALLAFALIAGILLWRLTTGKSAIKTAGEDQGSNISVNSKSEFVGGDGVGGGNGKGKVETLDETRKYLEEIFLYSQKINSILPKVQKDIEVLMQTWCTAGSEGFQKAVCFAEVVGKDLGRLPIPPDAVADVAAAFSKMSDLPLKEKQNIVEKIYWDLITIMNLGTDSLAQPFSYLTGVDPSMINELLMEENPKMKTMVSIYAPDETRQKMLAPLHETQKLEILRSAAELSSIPASELKTMNKNFQSKMKSGGSKDDVALDTSLEKIVSALTKFDEMNLLPQLSGTGIQNFKRKNTSVAFFHEWPNDKVANFITQLKTDHVVTYLRIKPDQKDRILGLCQPRAAAVIRDEVEREDKISPADKETHLQDIAELMYEYKENGNIDLEAVFPIVAAAQEENSNVKPIRSA